MRIFDFASSVAILTTMAAVVDVRVAVAVVTHLVCDVGFAIVVFALGMVMLLAERTLS